MILNQMPIYWIKYNRRDWNIQTYLHRLHAFPAAEVGCANGGAINLEFLQRADG